VSRHQPQKYDIDGIVLLDKPLVMSSNMALQTVKRLFNARKAGHTGSLDPLATGMLPICFGEATKFSQFLLDADKCYRVTGCLGIKTTTADSEGEIVSRVDDFEVTKDELLNTLSEFKGIISQVPSMYSAIKHNGIPLYKLARKGIEVSRKPRQITIHLLELEGFDGVNFELFVSCSKGTYIRNLIEDIGEALQVGAYVTKLRRLYTHPYGDFPMWTLDQLTEFAQSEPEKLQQALLPLETAISNWPEVNLNESMEFYVKNGQAVKIVNGPKSGWVRLVKNEDEFIGIGQILEDGKVAPRRLIKHKK
jgi:tRNA pseudouridine55 synthase